MDQAVDEAKQHKQHNGLFLIACARGLLRDAQQLLEWGASPAARDKQGLSPAHFAAAHGKHEMLSFLWSKGAELDGEDPGGRTPLHIAALSGYAASVRLLLQKGAWADAFDSGDNAALHLAARAGHLAVVKELLAAGAKVKVCNKRGLTPLAEAVAAGQLPCAKALVSAAAAHIGVKPRGYSLLHLAAGAGQADAASWLLSGGADLNDTVNEEGVAPLHCAAMSGSPDTVRLLLQHGARPQQRSKADQLPADLIPPDSKAYKALAAVLGDSSTSSGSKSAASAAKAETAKLSTAASGSPAEAFLAMPPAEQLRRAQRWSEDTTAPSAAAALNDLPDEVTVRIGEAAALGRALNVHKALSALHADEDFQQDLLRLSLQDVIDDIKLHPEHFNKHNANPNIARALDKIQQFHSVVKMNGGSQVSLEELSAGDMGTAEERDRKIRRELSQRLDAQLQAACAAARAPKGSADVTALADMAYAAAMRGGPLPANQQQAVTAGPNSSDVGVRSRKPPQRSEIEAAPDQPADAAKQVSGSSRPVDDQIPDLTDFMGGSRRRLSREEFWTAMKWQGLQLLLMLAALVFTCYVLKIGPWTPPNAGQNMQSHG